MGAENKSYRDLIYRNGLHLNLEHVFIQTTDGKEYSLLKGMAAAEIAEASLNAVYEGETSVFRSLLISSPLFTGRKYCVNDLDCGAREELERLLTSSISDLSSASNTAWDLRRARIIFSILSGLCNLSLDKDDSIQLSRLFHATCIAQLADIVDV